MKKDLIMDLINCGLYSISVVIGSIFSMLLFTNGEPGNPLGFPMFICLFIFFFIGIFTAGKMVSYASKDSLRTVCIMTIYTIALIFINAYAILLPLTIILITYIMMLVTIGDYIDTFKTAKK
jgi:hypothetical protein